MTLQAVVKPNLTAFAFRHALQCQKTLQFPLARKFKK